MNKQQALEKLTQLEAETKALRAIIEAPEPADSLLPSVKEGGYWFPNETQRKAMWFNDHNQRNEYMRAFETLLDLRRQPGSEAPNDEERQYMIELDPSNDVCVANCFSINIKLPLTSPCFATEEQAKAAIQTVGEDRILHMFNTLHGVK